MRTLLTLAWWTLMTPVAALLTLPYAAVTGDSNFLYRVGMWVVGMGIRLAGIRVEILGRERLDPKQTYIFMSNHVSNIDPPVLIPLVPGRTSVLVKKELFRIPILGYAMGVARMVPVDRHNRDAAIASVERAATVMNKGLNMMVFPEGTRSYDGKLLPFKKGPFYLAMETGVPVIPMTIVGSHELWPKGRFGITKGTVTVVFHDPVDPQKFSDREALITAVRSKIESALPEHQRGGSQDT
jgi:1-acyl-sn-glycerol-3-phosphate acyltransferase